MQTLFSYEKGQILSSSLCGCFIGDVQNSFITNFPTPSGKSEECKNLHNLKPDLMNTTVHLFTPSTAKGPRRRRRTSTNQILDNEHTFLATCYPAFSKNNPKRWCTIRKSGVFENKKSEANSGWDFCSTHPSQQECNGAITSGIEDSMPHKVTFLDDEYCLRKLRDNLIVEQPDEVGDLKTKVEESQTFCIGQIFNHSFEMEQFIYKDASYTNIDNITPTLKVSNISKRKWYNLRYKHK